MSKKFIALVLFAAMLVSMIPVASAAVSYDNNWPKITVLADGWYAGQNVENFDITSKTPSTTKTPNYTDAFGNGTTLTKLGSRYLNDGMTEGLKVEIKDYVPGATKVTGGYTVVDKNESFTIKISGKYSQLQPYYYSWLAQQGDIVDGKLDTATVKAFKAPAGVPVEVYATALHYAPCDAVKGEGFKVVVVLPRGTNTAKPDYVPANEEEKWLTARNKWLLAHEDANEAKDGAHVGLVGENIDIAAYI